MVLKLLRKAFLLFLFSGICAFIAHAQITIQGNVKDENNISLPGVTIVEKGTNNGTTTDLNGYFIIAVPQDAVLTISYVGYLTEEVTVKGPENINITMVPDIIAIGDVIVIGYGTIKKSDLTGSVASIKSDDLKNMPVTRVDEALQGKAAGVMVLQNSGQPGAAPVIRVRGLATVNGGDPLVVIDGVSGGSMANLNPNDIESIEVLKDAASQSIYGSAGGNGVILVTTKHGKAGKMQTSLDMYWGLQKPWNKVDVANAQEYAAIYNQFQNSQGMEPYFPYDAATNTYLNRNDSLTPLKSTNWLDEIFRTAMMQNYSFSVNGGSEKSNFYFGLGYSKQEGTLHRTYDDRYTIRLNSDHKITKRIKIGESLNFSRNVSSNQDERNEYNSPSSTAIQMLPFVPVFVPDGSGNYAYKESGLSSNIKNPMAQIAYNNNKTIENTLFGNIFMNVELLKGMSFESRFGFNLLSKDYTKFQPSHVIGAEDEANASQSKPLNDFEERVDNNYGWQWQNFITYGFTLLDNNNFTLMAGMESGYSRTSYTRGIATDVFNNTEWMQVFNGTSALGQLYGKPIDISGYAYFGRINYDYAGILLLQANIRRDASSKFGPNSRIGTFPAISAGLKFSEFGFIKDLNLIDFGKIRIGYGETGNGDIEPFLYINSIGSLPMNNYPFGGITQSGAALLTAANPDLKWETVVTENIGIDLGFLRNRLNLSFDMFARQNKDMLLRKSVPLTVGYRISDAGQELGDANLDTRPMVNYGTLNNKGLETTIEFKSKIDDLNFNIGVNLTHVVTTIDDIGDPLYEGDGRGLSNVCQTKNGQPISAFTGYKTNGVYQEDDFVWYITRRRWTMCAPDENGKNIIAGTDIDGNPVEYRVLDPNAAPGNLRFVDTNGDSTISTLDMTQIGDPNPDFTYGISLNMDYKGFDLNLFFQGSQGNDIYNMLKVNSYSANNGGLNWSPDLINSYIPAVYDISNRRVAPALLTAAENTNTGLPRMDADLSSSDFYVEDGSYLRLKNIQLGYTLPVSLTSKVKIERFRIYIGARNLLTFTKYKGFDPEVGETTLLERGFDRGTYPQSKMYMVGINLGF